MARSQAEEVAEALDSIDNIEAHTTGTSEQILVKVMDESAVGRFFAEVRRRGLRRDSTTRNCLDHAVLDSWVYPDDS